MAGIFISYRRDDEVAASTARQLKQIWEQGPVSEGVFLDVAVIKPGEDFYEKIVAATAKCDILIALIGADWLTCSKDGVRRLDHRDDYLRFEISTALSRNVGLIPVLLGKTAMPSKSELPWDLGRLATRQAARLTHEDFDREVERLTATVVELLKARSPFTEQLTELGQNLHHSALLHVPALTEWMTLKVSNLLIDSKKWRNGELEIPSERYNTVLLRQYSGARTSIFSTTIPEYVSTWTPDWMDLMIRASEESPAETVRRVFVFESFDEIDDRAYTILDRFRNSEKIDTRIYINQEDTLFNFAPEASRDFVVIDGGDTIGVTTTYASQYSTARFYFYDKARATTFQDLCEGLLRGSKKIGPSLERLRDAGRRLVKL